MTRFAASVLLSGIAAITGVASAAPVTSWTFTTLHVPGSDSEQAFGINDSGQIVGGYRTGAQQNAFLLSGGVYSTITSPSLGIRFAYDINNAGDIVGATSSRGYLLSDGIFTPIDYPPFP